MTTTPNQTTREEMGEVIAMLREKAEQVAAAKRNLHGLPIIAMESDSQPGRSALWMDNGLAGVGQVAISTGEFPCVQTGAVAALANVAASLDFATILAALQQSHTEGDRLAVADFLESQQDEPWPGGTESMRLHYWRDKAIEAARRLRGLSSKDGHDRAHCHS